MLCVEEAASSPTVMQMSSVASSINHQLSVIPDSCHHWRWLCGTLYSELVA